MIREGEAKVVGKDEPRYAETRDCTKTQSTKHKCTRAISCQPSSRRIIVVVWLPAIRQINVWIRVSGVLDTREETVRRDLPQTGETVERIVSAIGSISQYLFWGLDPAPIPIIPLIPRGLPGPLGQRLPLPRAQKPAHSPRSTRVLCMHVMCHVRASPVPPDFTRSISSGLLFRPYSINSALCFPLFFWDPTFFFIFILLPSGYFSYIRC